MIEEEREAERTRKRHQLFLRDQHRLELLQELGNAPAPGEFHPTAPLPESAVPANTPDDEDPAYDDTPDNDDEGKDEHWLPSATTSASKSEWKNLFFMFHLTEEAAWMNSRNPSKKQLSYILELKPEYPLGRQPEEE